MSLSNQWRANALDNIYGDKGSGSLPTIYVGLSSTQPTKDGHNITEPATGSYERVVVQNNSTNFPDATTSASVAVKSNGTKISFTKSTDAWLNGIALQYWFTSNDATATGSAMIDYAQLAITRSVDASGITLELQTGSMKTEIS